MKKSVTVTHWSARPQKDKWVVKFRQGGRREVRFFVTEKEAKAFAREKEIELRRRERGAPKSLRKTAMPSRLPANGVSASLMPSPLPEHVANIGRSISVSFSIDELLDLREAEGKSGVHLADLRHRLGAFAREHGNSLIASI